MKLLVITIIAEVIVGLYWSIKLLVEENLGWAGFYGFLHVAPFNFLFMMIASWSMFRNPKLRKLSILVFFLPSLFMLPAFLYRQIYSAPIPLDKTELVSYILIVVLSFILLFAWKFASYLPARMFGVFIINLFLTTVPVIGIGISSYFFFWYYGKISQDSSGIGLGFVVAIAALCVFASLPSFIYGYLGIFHRERKNRRAWHIAQLTTSLPASVVTAMVIGRFLGWT